ncbi:hypothetical protein KC207_10540 [Phycicoccus sp. BSK3Z-2]|uniref:ATP synthase protein I n=1 Tax=Phycicoccus avicenniae TaxID=2828860 RepID=A0A941DCA8_9MICO|nr:hypothetical protein [Phycicoccus avicenniae]MBR7743727.1 hypothetical protein [Phycicoccus avicenniae]
MSLAAAARTPVASMRRHVLVVGLPGIALAGLVGLLLGSPQAALSAAAGAFLVFVVMLAGLLGITSVVQGPVGLSLAGAAIVYIGQLVLVLAAIAVLENAAWLAGTAVALGGVTEGLLVVGAQVLGFVRARHGFDDAVMEAR